MTQDRTKVRCKMLARVQLFNDYNQTLVQANEVYWFEGNGMPSELTAVRVSDDTPLGPLPEDQPTSNAPPPYTTKGFIHQANKSEGARSVEDQLLG